jgi:hypothetical protein
MRKMDNWGFEKNHGCNGNKFFEEYSKQILAHATNLFLDQLNGRIRLKKDRPTSCVDRWRR